MTAVSGLGPLNQKGELTLALPLSAPHRERASIRRVVPQPPAPAVAFRRDARPGDRSLFVADLTTLPDDIDVRISGGLPAAERQHVDSYRGDERHQRLLCAAAGAPRGGAAAPCDKSSTDAGRRHVSSAGRPTGELARHRVRLATRRERAMPEYLAPAVYVEEIDTGSKPIEGVSTSTAGLIGVAERGPVGVPILITSWANTVAGLARHSAPICTVITGSCRTRSKGSSRTRAGASTSHVSWRSTPPRTPARGCSDIRATARAWCC